MRTLLALAITFSVFFGTNSYGGESLYTWRDSNGTLNITDSRPPAGAELLDVSPITLQKKPKAAVLPVTVKGKKNAQPISGTKSFSKEKKKLLAEAEKYSQQQKNAIKKGKALEAEIEAWQAKSGTKRKRRRNKRTVKNFNEQIVIINQEIKTAGQKAEALVKKAEGMQ